MPRARSHARTLSESSPGLLHLLQWRSRSPNLAFMSRMHVAGSPSVCTSLTALAGHLHQSFTSSSGSATSRPWPLRRRSGPFPWTTRRPRASSGWISPRGALYPACMALPPGASVPCAALALPLPRHRSATLLGLLLLPPIGLQLAHHLALAWQRRPVMGREASCCELDTRLGDRLRGAPAEQWPRARKPPSASCGATQERLTC